MTSQLFATRNFKTRALKAVGAGIGIAALTTLGACQQMQDTPKTTAGTLLGGVGGAVLGSQFGGGTGQIAATAAGTLLGAYLGSELGASLDRADKQALVSAQQRAYYAPVGETVYWNNPDSGNAGTITPLREGRTQAGQYCREFRTTVTIDGRSEQAYGTACQQADGSWRVNS